MAQIEFVISKLENKSDSNWQNCIDHLQKRYNNQIEDGSGNYTTSVTKGTTTTESHLKNTYSPNTSNPDVYELLDDWEQYVNDNLSRSKWRVHGLVVDYFAMDGDGEGYDMSNAGGVANVGSANNSYGGDFWASNARGTVHEAGHTMMHRYHWHHNMGRQDPEGDTTAMGVQRDNGCSGIDNLQQPDISSGTSKMALHTINAIQEFRDTESYYSGLKDCCYDYGRVKLEDEAVISSDAYGRIRPPRRVYRVDRLGVCGARADTPRDH